MSLRPSSPFHVIAVRCAVAVLMAAALWMLASPEPARSAPRMNWYKGNIHTHTINSDGDSTPDAVASWYKENRYHFLVLSDHNYLTAIEGLNAVHAAREKFLLIPGEEVTDNFEKRPVHINAIDNVRLIDPAGGGTLIETIQRNVDAIRNAQALPSLNHPNFRWAITSKELLEIRGLNHFEVYNGHPMVHNQGGGGFESLDEMWDVLLTAGQRIYGVAVDDAHHFKTFGKNLSNPGRGWVMVRTAELSRQSILRALEDGEFYASTGVELSEVAASDTELALTIREFQDNKYTTRFIGLGGKVLSVEHGPAPRYRFQGAERYVRAKVEASNGDEAWVQPVFRK